MCGDTEVTLTTCGEVEVALFLPSRPSTGSFTTIQCFLLAVAYFLLKLVSWLSEPGKPVNTGIEGQKNQPKSSAQLNFQLPGQYKCQNKPISTNGYIYKEMTCVIGVGITAEYVLIWKETGISRGYTSLCPANFCFVVFCFSLFLFTFAFHRCFPLLLFASRFVLSFLSPALVSTSQLSTSLQLNLLLQIGSYPFSPFFRFFAFSLFFLFCCPFSFLSLSLFLLHLLPMLVEEIPKQSLANSSTIYFLSLVNLLARPYFKAGENGEDANRNLKNRPKVNYNLTDLLNAQTQANYNSGSVASGVYKSSQQMQLERLVSKRLTELSKETPSGNFDLPKSFGYTSIHKNVSAADKKKMRIGNTPSTKRILAARRNLNSYFEEEKNLISINTILGVNYSFAEQSDVGEPPAKKMKRGERVFKPKVKLCCVCGNSSGYSRCGQCGLYSCSVRCIRLHHELRCT